ncbi:filamentous hemagglutinin family N-terminal domain-containing protein [Variovorax sp. PDC80]|uniref:filamentous haemagglutinin family protein n=1 Tax=Variovorax sp. PDC80 TaxID=1882827 RepID=UPI0008E932C8|nr:filamentous haemagglutinin family protein [Variovorax sp. PDC80]SFP71388.1 filamentous hemagglutinin family N-terminal domain-containing protein [Variovorax sp. PDC80]
MKSFHAAARRKAHGRPPASSAPASQGLGWRLTPPASAVAALLIAAGAGGSVHAQHAFSAGWMAQKNMAQSTAMATGRLPNGMPASTLTNPQAQQQQASAQLQRSIGNLNLAAQAIAAQQAAQAAARQAAQNDPSSVPDGLADGGLKVDTDSLTAGWLNANAPVQSQVGGRTQVAIQQTGDKAILNWESFNVGRNTTVQFQQQPDWAVLNRVNDPQARPSQIQGQIKGDGTVLIANRNGVVFSGSSQVDTRNLVAAAAKIGDEQFKARGIYSAQQDGTYAPSFTDALGSVKVEAGARIATTAPASVTQGGGYVLLLGTEVGNAGQISTPRGQVQLAAGDSFLIRAGQATTANAYATTRGNEVSPQFKVDSTAGAVSNTGLLQAPEGDITLAGRQVVQDGVALATTTVNARGSIHLLNSASDALGRVTIGAHATNAIVLDDSAGSALDSQRDALISESAKQDLARMTVPVTPGVFDNLARMDDRRDLSRLEIVSGGDVGFEGGSLTLATGGQVAVSAKGRSNVASQARLDVSGAVGVQVAMASNNVEINVQGNEQRDAPLNRDTTRLNNANVWIDRRKLLYVPAGVGGYDKERWYTQGGLLEVGGYLGLQGHGIGEWAAQGGSIAFAGGELVTQKGSNLNLSGGTLDVQTGMLRQSWLKGADGRLYRVDDAPADVQYQGLYKGYEDAHPRWGDENTAYYYNPLIGPQQRLESGYTIGRDAGQLIVATGAAVLEGDVTATAYQGPRQVQKPQAGLDGYGQSQFAAARAAQWMLGDWRTALNTDAKNGPLGIFHNLAPTSNEIVFAPDTAAVADSLQGGSQAAPLPEELQGKVVVDSRLVDGFGLGTLMAAAKNGVTVDGELAATPGGAIRLYAPQVDVNADLTARGGEIALGNVRTVTLTTGRTVDQAIYAAAGKTTQVTVGAGVMLDARGLWSNLQQDAGDIAFAPYIDGGSVSIRSIGDVRLGAGSVVDVSSGASVGQSGALTGGRGGDIALAASINLNDGSNRAPGHAELQLGGTLRGYGVTGGGSLSIESGTAIGIGGEVLRNPGELMAGEGAQVSLRLLHDYVIQPGETVPVDQITVSRLAPGEQVQATVVPALSYGTSVVVTAAAWRLGPGQVAYGIDARGATSLFQSGSVVPAGISLYYISQFAAGDVVPADAFPDGIPIPPSTQHYAPGSVASAPIRLAAGTLLAPGVVLQRDSAVQPVLGLDPSLFRSGFSHYTVTGHDGVAVLDGTQLDVRMPVYRWDGSAPLPPTGTETARALQLWTPPLYTEDPLHAKLAQRGGASLALGSQVAGTTIGAVSDVVPLSIGAGAVVTVDPGQEIALLSSGGQVTIDGTLNAWGGRISVASLNLAAGGPGTSIWIGDDARLDVAARPYVARDTLGRPYGIAPDGGSIELGLAQAFIVVRPGAVLDASGSQAGIDLAAGGAASAPAHPVQIAGDGGSIALRSYDGMFLDGQLLARAGGAGAAGGTLTLEMNNRIYDTATDDDQVLHRITLSQRHVPTALPSTLRPGQADAALRWGNAALGVDQIEAGGFDALTLYAHDLMVFDGDVDLSLGRSLNFKSGVFTMADGTPTAQVRIAAPYIRLDGGVDWTPNGSRYQPGLVGPTAGPGVSKGSLLSLSGDLIDIYGQVLDGMSVYLGGAGPMVPAHTASALAFDTTALTSSGDIRFAGAVTSSGDIVATAAQLYPMSGKYGGLLAGARGNGTSGGIDPDSVLAIRSNGNAAPVPASVFGALLLAGGTVDQGGVVRAPLGVIALNELGGPLTNIAWQTAAGANRLFDGKVVLRDGSLTSVSAQGLVMPFGGTQDGLTYQGASGTLFDLAQAQVNIAIAGKSIQVEPGAVLDLAGGGQLMGEGFVSGRGGSVNVLATPLYNANPALNRYSSAGNAVYAVVPGYAAAYAPTLADKGAGDPAIGQQVTVGAGVPGLPAGTYTLLPASYALLPGAFRVELGAPQDALLPARQSGLVAVPGGSWRTEGTLQLAGTGIRESLPRELLLTPGQAVRSYTQFNETSYADFALSQAAQFDGRRARLPSDGKTLLLDFRQSDEVAAPLRFGGSARFDAAAGGIPGQLFVIGNADMEITGPGAAPVPGAISLAASELSAFGASTLALGGWYTYFNGLDSSGDGARLYFTQVYNGGNALHVRDGATLRAGQIFLLGRDEVTVDGGATLDTRGFGSPGIDSDLGYIYANNLRSSATSDTPAVLAVGNGWLDFLPSVGPGRVTVADGATLLTEGTIAFAAPGDLVLGDARLGARYLSVSQNQINIGTADSLAAARAAGALPAGWQLTQDVLDRLLRPAADAGVPALERLSLSAGGAFNFFGSLSLDTGNAQAQLVLNTPAFYGWGDSADTVRIATRSLVWNGVATGAGTVASPYASALPAPVQAGGPGTGSGRLVIDAQSVQFGYDALSRPQAQATLDRVALGFAGVEINASDSIVSNSAGSLSVGHARGADGRLVDGDLRMNTPLLAGQAGSSMRYAAGGALRIATPEGVAVADTAAFDELGGRIALQGRSVSLDTAVALPSGRLDVQAEGDIALGDHAQIDLAGRGIAFFDLTRYSWGGSVTLTSTGGSIAQGAGSRIDVSAAHNDAGSLSASALGAGGQVRLGGTLRGQGGGTQEGRGFADGRFTLAADRFGDADFAAYNTQLDGAGFFGARDFTLGSGDLRVGSLRAHEVSITVNGGSLAIDGRIDASGPDVGSIALAARDDLSLGAGAVLDAHGTRLAVDSQGQAIDASNRARVSLATTAGTLRLAGGASVDLRAADDVARGQFGLAAPRIGETAGDLRIEAGGALSVKGAASIALDAFWTYTPTDANGTVTQDNGDAAGGAVGANGKVGLNQVDRRNAAFIDAAWANAALRGRLAGLTAYGDAFHLRPGVEIRASGDLSTEGDLDLSGLRYGPKADPARRGAGEPGTIVLRAAGDLNIRGSINDGFAPPGATPDDNGWADRPTGADGTQGRMWATAPMLAPGMQSWSMRLVSGADLQSADSRVVLPSSRLGGKGALVLDDLHYAGTAGDAPFAAVSVVRTGTGDLGLYAGGSYVQKSPFGVYTAGTQLADTGPDSGYNAPRSLQSDGTAFGPYQDAYGATLGAQRMWYAGGGGDLSLWAQGDITGFQDAGTQSVGEWLWRQGGDALGQKTGWGINFGSYAVDSDGFNYSLTLPAFSGIGALGGGNVSVRAGGNIGSPHGWNDSTSKPGLDGIAVAVGGSGRVVDGQLQQTGGGTLRVSAGGGIYAGVYANLRGDTLVDAQHAGTLELKNYGARNTDPRTLDPRTAYAAETRDALNFAPGDGTVSVRTLGDLALNTLIDPGRVGQHVDTAVPLDGNPTGGAGATWFTLWSEDSGAELFSAGGNLTAFGTTLTQFLPPVMRAVAAGGSIYNAPANSATLMLPSPRGALDLLAKGSVVGDSANNPANNTGQIGLLGSSRATLATPLNPAWRVIQTGTVGDYIVASNYWTAPYPFSYIDPFDYTAIYEHLYDYYGAHGYMGIGGTPFVFGPNTLTDDSAAGNGTPIHVYAVHGDVLGLQLGLELVTDTSAPNSPGPLYYQASKPVRVLAGGDIVGSRGLIVHDATTDVSMIAAGGSVIQSNFDIAGPGTLEVSAGRQIYQGNSASLTSLGGIESGDLRPGASIVLQAGLGAGLPGQGASDFAGFAARYLDPAHASDASRALADQPGKVAKTYDAELAQWLRERFGYAAASAADALAYFEALAPEQQRIFVRQVFYAELTAGGREYNDASSKRFGSYLRGRDAIAALFPGVDAQGRAIVHDGGITLYQGANTNAGVRTVAGGDIQTLAPGGTTLVGVEGITPSSLSGVTPAGLVTQGEGSIDMYSEGSILLGLSRIMTTFGGDILAWSATGDINAGRGAKTTLVYTPPKREYDTLGNVKLSPNVPSTGAGIATLNPIPEVPPGDVDLIAPLGTIDAGEAGIRVSGNVNLAALQVVNAANIQVQGKSAGIPVVAAVNVGALTNASAAASQAAMAAQDTVQRERTAARQALPSVFTVRVLGFGNESPAGGPDAPANAPRREPVSYDATSSVRVLGVGDLPDSARRQLTPRERANLGL